MGSKRLLITVATAVLILSGTYLAIKIAKGYRPTRNGALQGTGLLAANSFPNGAQVYLDGNLITATDNTLNLDPGEYNVEIKKEGFIPWKKRLTIEQELVTQTNATLYPSAPSLTPLTLSGATNLTPSPDGQRIAFYVASASAETKNGLYVLDLSDNLLSVQKGAKQIAQISRVMDLGKATVTWSPDSQQILLSENSRNVMLDASRMNVIAELQDVTYTLPRLFAEWEIEVSKRERTRLAKFPIEIQNIATDSAKHVYFSPDDEKVMYTITSPVVLPAELIPPVAASSTQTQERNLQAGGVYIYDRKEDRNFRVGTEVVATPTPTPKATTLKTTPTTTAQTSKNASPSASPLLSLIGETPAETLKNFRLRYSSLYAGTLQWFPDSRHVFGVKDNQVFIKEYDNTNEVVVYAGPFNPSFVYPWPNGSRVVMLTNFNQAGAAENLYAVALR